MNKELAKIFYALSYYLEMESIPFKPQAYQKAAGLLESLDENIEDIYKQGGLKALEDLPGIGKNIALKIEEYIKTGKIKMFEDYYRKIPVKIFDLLNINGLGPKTIYNLYKYLGIKDLKDLQIAIENNKIRTVPRLGVKTEMKLKKSLDFYNQKRYNLLTSKDLDQVDSDFGNLIKLSDIKGDLHIHTPRHSFV